MKKIISFSLYGKNPLYSQGAIINAQQMTTFYPDWTARFYIGTSISQPTVQKLQNLGAEVILMNEAENYLAMLWRFYAFTDSNVEFVLCRDADSRFSQREKEAVTEWLKSGKSFHIMRDHPYHNMPIMGGMWGGKTHYLRNIRTLINESLHKNTYGTDQFFLKEIIYPRIKNDACIHASFWQIEKNATSFPSTRQHGEFVGERFNENEQYEIHERNIVTKHENITLYKIWAQLKLIAHKVSFS